MSVRVSGQADDTDPFNFEHPDAPNLHLRQEHSLSLLRDYSLIIIIYI